jgi:hypothetical protein
VTYVVQTFGSRDISVDLQCTSLDELLNAAGQATRLDDVISHRFFQHDLVFLTNSGWA